MQELVVHDMWFQEDGATRHTERRIMDLLKGKFGKHFISCSEPLNFPPRSCDLTPLDYFLWVYGEAHIYTDKPASIGALEDNIEAFIRLYRSKFLKEYGAVAFNICMK